MKQIIIIILTFCMLSSFIFGDYTPQLFPIKIHNIDGGIYFNNGQHIFNTYYQKQNLNEVYSSTQYFNPKPYNPPIIADFFDLYPDTNKIDNMNLQIVSYSGQSISFYGYDYSEIYNLIGNVNMGSNIIDVIALSNPITQSTTTTGRKESLIVILENNGVYSINKYSFNINSLQQITPILDETFYFGSEDLTQKTNIDCDYYTTFSDINYLCGFVTTSDKIITFSNEDEYNKIINFTGMTTSATSSPTILEHINNIVISKGGTFEITFLSNSYQFSSGGTWRIDGIYVNNIDIDGDCDLDEVYCTLDFVNDVPKTKTINLAQSGTQGYDFYFYDIIKLEKTYFSVTSNQPNSICYLSSSRWTGGGTITDNYVYCFTDNVQEVYQTHELSFRYDTTFTTAKLNYLYLDNNIFLTYPSYFQDKYVIMGVNINNNIETDLIESDNKIYHTGSFYLYDNNILYHVYYNTTDSLYYSYNTETDLIEQLNNFDGLPYAKMFTTNINKNTNADFVFSSVNANYVLLSEDIAQLPFYYDNTLEYKGIFGFYNPAMVNTTQTFKAIECEYLDWNKCTYYIDFSYPYLQEKICSDCGGTTTYKCGNYDINNPQLECYFNVTGNYDIELDFFSNYNENTFLGTINFNIDVTNDGNKVQDIIIPQNPFIDEDDLDIPPTPSITGETAFIESIFGLIQTNIKLIFALILCLGLVITTAQAGIRNPLILLLAFIVGLVIVTMLNMISIGVLIIMLVTITILVIASLTIFKNSIAT